MSAGRRMSAIIVSMPGSCQTAPHPEPTQGPGTICQMFTTSAAPAGQSVCHPALRVRAGNSHNFSRYILGPKHEIDTAAVYCASGHIGLAGGIRPLRDCYAPNILYAAQ